MLGLGFSFTDLQIRGIGAAPIPTIPFLRGANFSGIEYTPGEQQPLVEAHEYYLVKKGMNVVRLPIKWEMIQPALNGALDTTYCGWVDTQISMAVARGARIILDVHNYGRRTISSVDYIIGETPTVTAAHFADLWSKLTTRFPHANVLHGLMNEPHDQDADIYVTVANTAIAAIRAAGSNKLILVNGNDWGVTGWRPEYTNQVKMLGITDPKNNFAFDVHLYFDSSASGQTPILGSTTTADTANVLNWANTNNKKIFWGEFACDCYNPAAKTAMATWLAQIEASPKTIGWTYWGAGGWQGRHNRWMHLDPHMSRWEVSNPLNGVAPATMWASATTFDRPQMQVLLPYLPAATEPYKPMFRASDIGATVAAYYAPFQYTVGTWRGFAGAGLTTPIDAIQATAANQPAMGATGTVTFDGTNDKLTTAVTASNSNETIFALVTPANLTGDKTIVGSSLDNGRQAKFVAAGFNVLRQNTAYKYGGGTATAAETSVEFSSLTPAVVGDQNVIGVNATRTQAGYTENADFVVSATTIIGTKAAGDEPFNGTMTELIFLSSRPNATLRQKIEGYRKWEFGTPLPGGHPYLSVPPPA